MHMRILGLEQNKEVKTFLNRNYLYISYFFFLFLSIILILIKNPLGIYLLFLLIGLGWSIFFFKDRFNLLEHILLSPVISASIFVFFSIIFALVNIKLTILIGILFFVLSVIFFIVFHVFSTQNIKLKIDKFDVIILILFLLSSYAKISSVSEFYVPPLHDPISHAHFSKVIAETGYINYFYSPGLHILGAFGQLFSGFNVAKQILYISNFFNAYSGVIVYLFVKQVFKSKVWAVSSALLFSLGYFPSNFYLNAGKNALVLGICLLFLFFLVVEEYRRKKDLGLMLLSNIIIASIFFVHYPTAVFACTYLLGVFFVDYKKEKLKTVLLGIGILLGFAFMAKTYKYNSTLVNAASGNSSIYTIPVNFVQNTKDFIKHLWSIIISEGSVLKNFIEFSAITSLGLIVLKAFKSKKYTTLVLWMIFSVLVSSILQIFMVTPFLIVLETFLITLPMYVLLCAGLLISVIYKYVCGFMNKRIVNVSFMLIVLISGVYLSYRTYNQFFKVTDSYNVVQESDMRSFEWINENIPDDDKFLINGNGGNGLVFSTDGGGWLEVFTDNAISTPFYDYGSKETDNNIKLYVRLKNNLNDCDAINTLIDNGYKYYYQGSKPVFNAQIGDKNSLLNTNRFEILFEDGNSAVYKLIKCD